MTEKRNDSRTTWTDPDEAPELTDEWFEGADLMEGTRLARRGRPPSEKKKVLLTVRYSQEVVDYVLSRHCGAVHRGCRELLRGPTDYSSSRHHAR